MADIRELSDPHTPSWTSMEKKIISFRKIQCEGGPVALRDGLEQKMRESTLGIFLHHLNRVQLQRNYIQQDKLDRVNYDIVKNLENMTSLERRNNITEDVLGLIQDLLLDNSSGTVGKRDTLEHLTVLRLVGAKVSVMDSSIRRLARLKALSLAGNCLAEVPGHWLPRGLLLLEMCCNAMRDVTSLVQDCPPHMLYLGLARNHISQGAMQDIALIKCLYHLDLSHNNVVDLTSVVPFLVELDNLTSLLLVGNPCSMTVGYACYIKQELPRLVYLDGEILKREIEVTADLKVDQFSGILQIYTYRIMSLPQPPNQKINKKKVINTFRVEVDCPLLASNVPQREEEFVEDPLLKTDIPDMLLSKKKKNSKAGKKERKRTNSEKYEVKTSKSNKEVKEKNKLNKSLKENKLSKKSEYLETNEFKLYDQLLSEDRSDSKFSFVSQRKAWARIVEFDVPSIEVADCDLTSLRDVFKSNLILRIVHIKTLPPLIEKKRKKSKSKGKKSTVEEDKEKCVKVQPKEILVSKATISRIILPLEDIMWNTRALDYSWNKTKPLKAELTTGLKDLQFVIKKKKPPKGKKEKAVEKPTELPIPGELTCHFGIGVMRFNLFDPRIKNTDLE